MLLVILILIAILLIIGLRRIIKLRRITLLNGFVVVNGLLEALTDLGCANSLQTDILKLGIMVPSMFVLLSPSKENSSRVRFSNDQLRTRLQP